MDHFWVIYSCFQSNFCFWTFLTCDFDSFHYHGCFQDNYMAEMIQQKDSLCQADHFSLLKLLKRSGTGHKHTEIRGFGGPFVTILGCLGPFRGSIFSISYDSSKYLLLWASSVNFDKANKHFEGSYELLRFISTRRMRAPRR